MEKDGILGGNPSADFNWPSNTISPPAAQVMGMNLDSGGNSSFPNLNNWEQSPVATDDTQTPNFESALSSLVSSPTTSAVAGCNFPSTDSILLRELIGRLGNICNNNDSNNNYQITNDNTAASSCYATPLSSPPKPNLSIPQFPPPGLMGVGVNFVTDLGFAERAARYSCFGAARNYGQFGELSSVQSLKENDMTKTKTVIMGRPDWDLGLNVNNSFKSGNALDDSPPWDRTMTPSCEVRKRKSTVSLSSSSSKGSRGGGNPRKASADEKSNSKRCKSWSAAEAEEDDIKDTMEAPKVDQNNSAAAEKENGKDRESNAKPPEPPEPPKQDYIHVRARRGQATDSHSLAERVRRERISERMKFLQDLVPGCNKVTGKAVMLDEIINYVQSLQRQVEFLSMKLATVNPRMDEYDFSYTSQQQGQGGPPLRSLMASNAHETQLDVSWLNRHLSMQLPSLDGFTDSTGAFWEDDLHSVVQMGFVQNHEATVSSHNLHGPTSHMKIEL